MNLLFLTLLDFETLEEHNIYTDLLRQFHKNKYQVYVISPVERRRNRDTEYKQVDSRLHILKLKIGNMQKTNLVEKGISTLMFEPQVISAIKKYFCNVRFDLVLYTTPPITLQKAVAYVKKRDHAVTYLMLKDIFPQNAVDMGMLSTKGIKGLLYQYFRRKEKYLYQISDYIGCMSEANIQYILEHNPQVDGSHVELCPNAIEPIVYDESMIDKKAIRKELQIPEDRLLFIYGGNLGKPQGISFMIECIKSQLEQKRVYFLIVGNGTEYGKLEQFLKTYQPDNVKLMSALPKQQYENIVKAADVGMIFLDDRFTIPNFPSRILSYMQAKIPVLAVTDRNTDVGLVIQDGKFGWWCESNQVEGFRKCVEEILDMEDEKRHLMGQNGYQYLVENYHVEKYYKVIDGKLDLN